MRRIRSFSPAARTLVLLTLLSLGFSILRVQADTAVIRGQDVNGRAIAVNGARHDTVVLYTNPDLEDASRQITLALDPFRSRSDFAFIRLVDLRSGVPPEVRGIVRSQNRQEMAKENVRLEKQLGIENASAHAPIIADFSGSTLNALGWDDVYTQIHLVVYDRSGHEIKRLADVSNSEQLTKVVSNIL